MGKFTNFVFRRFPGILLAEPFECFLVLYSMLAGLSIVNSAFNGPAQPQLFVVLGRIGLIIWATVMIVGAILVAYGLIHVSRKEHSTTSTDDRKFEYAGLTILLVTFGFYALILPFRLRDLSNQKLNGGASTEFIIFSTVLTELTLLGFAVAILVRMVTIHSPIWLTAMNRLQRVRMMKKDLEALENGDTREIN